MDAKVYPVNCLSGSVHVPGDKSISHRLAMFSALAHGTSRIRNFLRSDDCLRTVQAVAAFGAEVAFDDDTLVITGQPWRAPRGVLDLGNSGTSLRLLAGLAAGRPWTTEMTGDASLRSRPMERIRVPLEMMGARVELKGPRGCAPLAVTGGALRGISYRLPVASAQVKSCVLLAGLFAEGETTLWEPKPTRDHTEIILQKLGVDLQVDGLCVRLRGYGADGPSIPAGDWRVPGDFSSAAFWLVAGAAMPEAGIVVSAVGLNPRRTALLDILRRMGAEITVTHIQDPVPEPMGDLRIHGRMLQGTEIGGEEVPAAIDELPIAAVAGALARGETIIRDAQELRVKESDRISCMVRNLRQMGVAAEELPDGMRIQGGRPVRGNVRVESFGDHRIAMALAVLALFADAPVTIADIDCIQTSYPSFWQHFRGVGGVVQIIGENA